MNPSGLRRFSLATATFMMLAASCQLHAAGQSVFNVRDYGATGHKSADARPAIQKAIDACAKAGGGTVYLPPGEYTSGTLYLRSHVRFYVEAGATLYASEDPKAFNGEPIPSKAALLFGENVENISIEGRGTIDGQAEYEWRPDDFEHAYDHKDLMQALGKSTMRSFPKDQHTRTVYPHLVWLGRCKDVRITGLSFLHSFSWTFAFYDCERMVIDGLYIYTSLKEAVWADGIDIDSSRDIHISNCDIETGDDCIIFISGTGWGPALPCENITVTNCKLSSASAAIKFSEGNRVAIRKIVVDNCVITNCNRGITFQIVLGGTVSDVILSNLTIDLHRFDWFWAGDGNPFDFGIKTLSEWNRVPPKPDDPGPGTIRNVVIRNVIAHGQGSSLISGHPKSWLEGISFENIKLFLSTDPAAPYDKAVHALEFRYARDLKLRNVEVIWDKPALDRWESALSFNSIEGLEVDGFTGRPAWIDREFPAISFTNVADAVVRNSKAAQGTNVFLKISGSGSRDVALEGNDFRLAKVPYQLAPDVAGKTVTTEANLLPSR